MDNFTCHVPKPSAGINCPLGSGIEFIFIASVLKELRWLTELSLYISEYFHLEFFLPLAPRYSIIRTVSICSKDTIFRNIQGLLIMLEKKHKRMYEIDIQY